VNSICAGSVLNRMNKISVFHQILNILLLIVFGFLIEGFIINLSDHNLPSFYINHKLFCISFLSSSIIILLITSIILYVFKRSVRSNFEEDEIMPTGNANLSYISSKEDRDRKLSLYSESLSYSSPSHSRPCSMLYPYVSSAPPPYDSESRQLFPGGRRCHHPRCNACLWLKEGPNFSSSVSKRRFKFMTPTTCTERNIIYLVTCNSCRKQYVGKTEMCLREAHLQHQKDIENQGSLLGRHFGSNCGPQNWNLQIIDKSPVDELSRREQFWQEELTTLFPLGLNETVK